MKKAILFVLVFVLNFSFTVYGKVSTDEFIRERIEDGEEYLEFEQDESLEYVQTDEIQSATAITGSSIDNYTWKQINEIASSGKASEYFSIGDTKDIQLTTGEVLTVQIYGFNHDDVVDENGKVLGKAGITFGLKDLMATKRRINSTNTNIGGFAVSELCSLLNGSVVYDVLSQDVKSVILPVVKDDFFVNVFLFSTGEVFGNTAYPIFTGNASRIKKLSNGSGVDTAWWCRSIVLNETSFRIVDVGGTLTYYSSASVANGINFGFCVGLVKSQVSALTDIVSFSTIMLASVVNCMQNFLDFIVKNPVMVFPLILFIASIVFGFIRKVNRSVT